MQNQEGKAITKITQLENKNNMHNPAKSTIKWHKW